MQKFTYRIPRYAVNLPVSLRIESLIVDGRCREISIEGMSLELAQEVPQDSRGTVTLHYQGQAIELQVRLAHSGVQREGFRFVFASDKERDAIARLVARVAAGPGHTGPVLVE
jgi:hypothetical protein